MLLHSEKLSTLDYVFTALSRTVPSLDFAFVLHFAKPPDIAALELGARSARNKYPTTSSLVHGGRWEYVPTAASPIEQTRTTNAQKEIERFMNLSFDLRVDPPCRQLLIQQEPGNALLVSRFHHAAADGMSAALWLGHQLQVANGLVPSVNNPAFYSRPSLRYLNPSVRRSKFAYDEPSDPLKISKNQPSGERRWLTLTFPATDLRRACKRRGGFTYNDLLATCALEVLEKFKSENSATSRIGLWVPVNIRCEASSGFGNGTSRIRIYRRYMHDASLVHKAREVRHQISWCTEHGEWVVPEIPLFTKLPRWATARVLKTYLNSRSVDMATAVFSHADSWASGAGKGLQCAERIECIGVLHPRQSVAINGTTHRGQTVLTFTYDSGSISDAEASQLSRSYGQQIALAREDLSKCND